MLESVLLEKNRIRSAKNVIFSLLCILVDRSMGGGLNPQNPPPAYALACIAQKLLKCSKDLAEKHFGEKGEKLTKKLLKM